MDKSFVYAIGYEVYKGEKKLFYKSNTNNSNDLVIECLNSILVHKYNNYTFYVHNLQGFDVVFILDAMEEYNNNNGEYYKYSPIFRDNRIISLTIKIKTKSGTIKIKLVDSYGLLNKSLYDIGVEFECEVVKDKFCHDFVKESTLNYIGNTPDKFYFKNMSDNEYNIIKKSDWNLKKEALDYLSKDLGSLLEIMDKFNRYVFCYLRLTNNWLFNYIKIRIKFT